ncbi:hypothetical protein C2E23DRAFT_838899 [Lenzites betulinus]|nr:hypothetical protein C2E23DRAFT_838899 [Lenzites betulinus]
MLVSTVVVVWRSRPAALARAHQKQLEARQQARSASNDLESGHSPTLDKPRISSELPVSILRKHLEDATEDDESMDGSPEPETPQLGHGHGPSAVNVIIATDGAGGVEVRVTPPTPSQSMAALAGKPKAERRVRFETLGGVQGEHESVWWFI